MASKLNPNAAEFVPRSYVDANDFPAHRHCRETSASTSTLGEPSWADVVSNGGAAGVAGADAGAVGTDKSLVSDNIDGAAAALFNFEEPCSMEASCSYAMPFGCCNLPYQYCFCTLDQSQPHMHMQQCIEMNERARQMSIAIERSKDKVCGICLEIVRDKTAGDNRFGILPNCSHIFCLKCIRQWRQAKDFKRRLIRACPECRVESEFVCPSAYWVETQEEKQQLLDGYREALRSKDCKYFRKGNGHCPFGNKCFYKHALANGELVDVGKPNQARKIWHSSGESVTLGRNRLYDFLRVEMDARNESD